MRLVDIYKKGGSVGDTFGLEQGYLFLKLRGEVHDLN